MKLALNSPADQALFGTNCIAKIVQAIKEFSYPSSNAPASLDLNHLINLVTTVTRNQWKYVAEMDLELSPELLKISAIEGEINQMLVNLIVNAAQAIGEKQEADLGNIRIQTRNSNGGVELTIADSGKGIPPEIMPRIFDMFFTTKPPGQGTGQGLAITQAIVHRHNGKISVKSEPGAGACFTVWFPCVSTT